VRQASGHRVAWCAFAAAPPAPLIRRHDAAGEHSTVRFEPLAGDLKPERVEASELGQVRAREGSVVHVEVSRLASGSGY